MQPDVHNRLPEKRFSFFLPFYSLYRPIIYIDVVGYVKSSILIMSDVRMLSVEQHQSDLLRL